MSFYTILSESELVSGFMTEHSAVIFVFFFLAEYASIVLICILTSILFLGGYLLNIMPLIASIMEFLDILSVNFFILLDNIMLLIWKWIFFDYNIDIPYDKYIEFNFYKKHNLSIMNETTLSDPSMEGMFNGLIIGLKACIMIFTFIWARASFPRIRFDQLMSFCWTILLPIVVAFIILIPCILYSFEILPTNITLFYVPFVIKRDILNNNKSKPL